MSNHIKGNLTKRNLVGAKTAGVEDDGRNDKLWKSAPSLDNYGKYGVCSLTSSQEQLERLLSESHGCRIRSHSTASVLDERNFLIFLRDKLLVGNESEAKTQEVLKEVDDNGNPLSKMDPKEESHGGGISDHSFFYRRRSSPDEVPKYFINAANLDETSDYEGPHNKEYSSPVNNMKYSAVELKKYEIALDQDQDAIIRNRLEREKRQTVEIPEKCTIRVPISKSYPDIIQTTFAADTFVLVNDKGRWLDKKLKSFEKSKENEIDGGRDNFVNDSLEDIANFGSVQCDKKSEVNSTRNGNFQNEGHLLETCTPKRQQEPRAFLTLNSPSKPENDQQNFNIPNSGLTDSQQSGIISEKPPEAWVIDINSISIDSELEMNRSNYSSNSNPNSLAFFVDINDESLKEDAARQASETNLKTSDNGKKIFSMFVDIGESKGEANSPRSSRCENRPRSSASNKTKIPINKPMKNLIKMSTYGSSSDSLPKFNETMYGPKYLTHNESADYFKKFPSPLARHKHAAENARLALQCPVSDDGGNPSCEKNQFNRDGTMGDGSYSTYRKPHRKDDSKNEKTKGILDSVSNRSSLHVANVLENSISSSILSSMEASVLAAETEEALGEQCLKLGEDLLRMFQEAINTDINISIDGRVIKAHKCILASRSQYFAAILSGNWVQKAGNTVVLDGFSYNVVQFGMYHIYSGTNEIPDHIDILELATLADLLGLEGLRENISQTIRSKFCHNFHRPCTGCITGVLECFPIAVTYGMDDLSRRMTKWICKHFVRIWPCKAYAGLGEELNEKCLNYSIHHLSVDNILDHTLGCDQLLTTMPSVRWSEPIFSLVSQLSEACVLFIGENLSQVLQSQKFLLFGKGQTWNVPRIEEAFKKALYFLKPDEACLSHAALTRLLELGIETKEEVEWSSLFVQFLKSLKTEIEKYLLANASKAVLSKNWETLSQNIRKKICATSFVGHDKRTGVKGAKVTCTQPTANNRNRKDLTSRSSSFGASARTDSVLSSKSERNNSKDDEVSEKSSSARTPAKAINNTRVASVRPMRSEVTGSNRNLSDSQNNLSNSNSPACKHKAERPATPNRGMHRTRSKNLIERDKSFSRENSTIKNEPIPKSSTSSASRTPLKPLTPVTPSKTLMGQTARSNSAPKVRGAKTSRSDNEEPKKNLPNKTFITNSARAAAVSKPQLKSTKKPVATACVDTNRKRSEAEGKNSYSESLSSRSSFSSKEKPLSAGTRRTCDPKTDRQKNHSRTTTTTRSKSAKEIPSRDHDSARRTRNFNHTSNYRSRETDNDSESNSISNSFSADSSAAMSKSTIETESGEPKVRTLAEIGRSNTFSKDEPTVLGKFESGSNHEGF